MQDYLKLANTMIEQGKGIDKVEYALTQHYLQLDKQEFNAQLKAEYDELFPATREATDEEIQKDYEEFCIAFGVENVKHMYSPIELVKIDYSEDENYVTFEEYKNETRVVSEAVEATYDDEGMVLTEAVAEVSEAVRPYVASEITDGAIAEKLIEFGYDYATKRVLAYPSIEEQLDEIYHDGLDSWKATILAVKAKYPKG